MRLDLAKHLHRQIAASKRNFGPDTSDEKLLAVVKHIEKELVEIRQSPRDVVEWIDVIILGFDGAWRAGYTPEQIVASLTAKQTLNEARQWPDWRTAKPGEPIEHVRDEHL